MKSYKRQRQASLVLRYLLLTLLAIIWIFPIVWIILTAFLKITPVLSQHSFPNSGLWIILLVFSITRFILTAIGSSTRLSLLLSVQLLTH